jgi:TfoX/Sxy family transcriptional regulator of competence genes
MPYDEHLADRVRRVLADRRDVVEKAMFGGLAFMVRGHMTCGLVGETLMLRVDPAEYASLVDEPHARPMDFTGRPMKGFLYVDPDGLHTPSALRRWIARATDFVDGLPEKPVKVPGTRARTRTKRQKPRAAAKRRAR